MSRPKGTLTEASALVANGKANGLCAKPLIFDAFLTFGILGSNFMSIFGKNRGANNDNGFVLSSKTKKCNAKAYIYQHNSLPYLSQSMSVHHQQYALHALPHTKINVGQTNACTNDINTYDIIKSKSFCDCA